MEPRLIIEQKITAFANKYKVHDEQKNLIALAQQKRLAFKEKVTFYNDEKKSEEVFTFRAEKVMDVHGRYFVEGANGEKIGMFRKEFKKSLLVSSWVLMDADGNDVYRVKENNVVIAVLRRFIGFVPFIGELLELVIMFFRYHFEFIDMKSGEVVGKYRKTKLFRDHYELETTDEAWNALDWRVFAAMGVALDALQSR